MYQPIASVPLRMTKRQLYMSAPPQSPPQADGKVRGRQFKPGKGLFRAGGGLLGVVPARNDGYSGRRWQQEGSSSPEKGYFGPEVPGGRRAGRRFWGRVSSGVSLLAPLAAKKGLFVVRGAARDTPGDGWLGARISSRSCFSFSPLPAPVRFLCMPFRPSCTRFICQAPVSAVMRLWRLECGGRQGGRISD